MPLLTGNAFFMPTTRGGPDAKSGAAPAFMPAGACGSAGQAVEFTLRAAQAGQPHLAFRPDVRRPRERLAALRPRAHPRPDQHVAGKLTVGGQGRIQQ